MLSIIVETFIVIILCVDKRRNLLLILSHGSLRTASTYASGLKPARNASQSSDICSWFWAFIASESFVRKHARMTLSMIVACGVEVIESTPLCDLSLDLCKIMKCSNVSLTSSSSTCSSSFFFLHLELRYHRAHCRWKVAVAWSEV